MKNPKDRLRSTNPSEVEFIVDENADMEQPPEAFLKRDDEQRIVWGWASVIEEDGEVIVDVQGDTIDEVELQKAAHDYITEARAAKLLHKGARIGRVVESVVFTKALQKALGIDLGKTGWFIGMKIEDERVWKAVKDGTLRAFSVGGSGRRIREG